MPLLALVHFFHGSVVFLWKFSPHQPWNDLQWLIYESLLSPMCLFNAAWSGAWNLNNTSAVFLPLSFFSWLPHPNFLLLILFGRWTVGKKNRGQTGKEKKLHFHFRCLPAVSKASSSAVSSQTDTNCCSSLLLPITLRTLCWRSHKCRAHAVKGEVPSRQICGPWLLKTSSDTAGWAWITVICYHLGFFFSR